MKHVKRIAMIMILAAFLVGCGGKPKRMDQNTYDLGCKALEIMDSYNKMEIDKDSAYDQLGEIYDRLKTREFGENEDDQEFQNGLVTADILCYQVAITSGSDLIKKSDNLRKTLNK